jgi:hypothetical protein
MSDTIQKAKRLVKQINSRWYAEKIIAAVQELEEMGGPDTLDQYLAVLSIVQHDIDRRKATATRRIMDEYPVQED